MTQRSIVRECNFLLIATLFVVSNALGQSLTPDHLADKLIIAFQTKNFELYKKLLLDTTDYNEFLNDFSKNNHVSKIEQEEFKEKRKHFADSADIQYHKEFKRLLDKGVTLGIDWTQIKKATFVFKEHRPVNSEKQSLTGYLNFTDKEKTYVFFGIEAMQLSSGYKIYDIRTILKGGIDQYVEPDLLDDDDL